MDTIFNIICDILRPGFAALPSLDAIADAVRPLIVIPGTILFLIYIFPEAFLGAILGSVLVLPWLLSSCLIIVAATLVVGCVFHLIFLPWHIVDFVRWAPGFVYWVTKKTLWLMILVVRVPIFLTISICLRVLCLIMGWLEAYLDRDELQTPAPCTPEILSGNRLIRFGPDTRHRYAPILAAETMPLPDRTLDMLDERINTMPSRPDHTPATLEEMLNTTPSPPPVVPHSSPADIDLPPSFIDRFTVQVRSSGLRAPCLICMLPPRPRESILLLPCHPTHWFHKRCGEYDVRTFGRCPLCKTSLWDIQERLEE